MKKSTLEAARAELQEEAAAAWAELVDAQAELQKAHTALWEKWTEGLKVRKAKLAKLQSTEAENEETDCMLYLPPAGQDTRTSLVSGVQRP